MATTTPTPFNWPSGPQTVQISGDWDHWAEKVDLDKQSDGSFSKKISLPSNTKVHYKYIVDGKWTTNSNSPLVEDGGNQNNVVDVGPAPNLTESATTTAGEIGAGLVAGITGVAAAAGAAATRFTDHVNGTTDETVKDTEEPKKEVSQAEKLADPAATLKTGADQDIRNHIPTSITTASHAAAPAIAGAIATVTGADILRGNAEALPVTEKEIKSTQADAMKGDNSFLSSRLEPEGGAISDPKAAVTDNSNAAATVANSATEGAPIVPVTHTGFAANVTGTTGNLTTADDSGKEGGEKAGAVAAASSGALGAAVVGGTGAFAATNGHADPASKEGTTEATPIAVAPDSKAAASTGSNVSKQEADKAAAPAAASTAPLASGKETTTSSEAEKVKSTPVAAPVVAEEKKSSSNEAEKVGAASAVAASAPLVAEKEKTKSNEAQKAQPAPAATTEKERKTESATPHETKKSTPAPAAASSKPVDDKKIESNPVTEGKINAPLVATANASGSKTPTNTDGQDKSLPVTPTKKAGGKASLSKGADPGKAKYNTVTGARRKSGVESNTTTGQEASVADSEPSTPDRKRKQSFFGKIKSALSPSSSPSK